MKRRHVLYALCIAGLAVAVLSDRLVPAQDEGGSIVRPVIRSPAPRATRVAAEAPRMSNAASSNTVLALAPRDPSNRPPAVDPKQRTTFSARTWAPSAPTAPSVDEPAPIPPVPFSYIGKRAINDEWQVFIAEKDDVRAVKVSDVIDERYQVVSIDSATMTLDYLPLHAKVTMSLE